jgi:hypothetical protein
MSRHLCPEPSNFALQLFDARYQCSPLALFRLDAQPIAAFAAWR